MNHKVYKGYKSYYNMETTLKVTKETRRRINGVKYKLDCKTVDETINKVLNIIEKIEAVK